MNLSDERYKKPLTYTGIVVAILTIIAIIIFCVTHSKTPDEQPTQNAAPVVEEDHTIQFTYYLDKPSAIFTINEAALDKIESADGMAITSQKLPEHTWDCYPTNVSELYYPITDNVVVQASEDWLLVSLFIEDKTAVQGTDVTTPIIYMINRETGHYAYIMRENSSAGISKTPYYGFTTILPNRNVVETDTTVSLESLIDAEDYHYFMYHDNFGMYGYVGEEVTDCLICPYVVTRDGMTEGQYMINFPAV